MAKKNHAKKALISSLLALFICFTMLIGTTFAWFTDTAVSSNNIIKSGTLDVEMFWADGKEDPANATWIDASEGAIFNYELWEPGYVQVRHIKIANKGNLALKYQISIVANGEVSKLSDVIDVYYVDPAVQVDDRGDLTDGNKLGTLTQALAGLGESGTGYLVPKPAEGENEPAGFNSEETITIALKMQEDAGNEYQNLEIGTDFAVQLVATQYTYEKDSFDDQYDKDAEYPEVVLPDHFVYDLDDLKIAFEEGGNVLLAADIELEKITPVAEGKEVHLDMNGKTITVDENTTSNTLIWVKNGAKLTIDGNGTIDLGPVSTMAIFCPYGELVIENGTFIRDEVTTVTDKTTGLFMGAKESGCNVTINGGYFDPGYYDENAANIEKILEGTETFNETADDIAKRGKPGDANLVRVAVKDNVSVVLNHSGYGSFKVYGGTFVGANPAWGDEGCMLPTTPNYLRPWSYYQGALLAGQTFNENGIVLPDGYTINKGATTDGIPTYTVQYSK